MKLSDDFLYFLEIHTLYKEEKKSQFLHTLSYSNIQITHSVI